ncbi:unnamed protein product [Pleuronectes platessa]|uniref:Uncharacterized protein n=1 Tax=Pleuronectes platessa TaxID=8262 RepID=A0A9N7UA00_PLEPL|nr:unnamed protein product [Pleuronectes platessa]
MSDPLIQQEHASESVWRRFATHRFNSCNLTSTQLTNQDRAAQTNSTVGIFWRSCELRLRGGASGRPRSATAGGWKEGKAAKGPSSSDDLQVKDLLSSAVPRAAAASSSKHLGVLGGLGGLGGAPAASGPPNKDAGYVLAWLLCNLAAG